MPDRIGIIGNTQGVKASSSRPPARERAASSAPEGSAASTRVAGARAAAAMAVPLGSTAPRGSRYAKQISEQFPARLKSNDDAPDAVTVYRRVLAGQKDGSVVVVTVRML